MRFLILTQYFPPEVGAMQVRLAAMARELVRLGHRVEVVTALPNYPTGRIFADYRGRWYASEERDGVVVHRVWAYASMGAGLKRLLNYGSFALSSLVGLWRAQRPDYIFVESPPLFLSLPAQAMAWRWRVPFIFNVSDLWPDSAVELGLVSNRLLLRLAAWLERWSYRNAAYVTAVTEGIAERLIQKKGVPPHKVLFLPNGVDTELFAPRAADDGLARALGLDGQKVILYAGNMGYVAGLETALEAVARLQASLPQVTMVFVGGGSEREKLTRSATLRGLTNVRFLDPRPVEEVARLYGIACAGFASLLDRPLFEGARPAKVPPIMASGKPVLYAGRGEGARLVEGAGAGLVVPPEAPGALADAIRFLVENPQRGAEMGANGRSYVREHLSWEVLVSRWLRQLEERRGVCEALRRRGGPVVSFARCTPSTPPDGG